jgi:hypothetical protein
VVRNSSFPAHVEQVVIKNGGAPVKIRHKFR